MEYEDFKIGDRVGRFYGNKVEKATVVDVIDGLYELQFDDDDYINLICDNEKIFKIKDCKDKLDSCEVEKRGCEGCYYGK